MLAPGRAEEDRRDQKTVVRGMAVFWPVGRRIRGFSGRGLFLLERGGPVQRRPGMAVRMVSAGRRRRGRPSRSPAAPASRGRREAGLRHMAVRGTARSRDCPRCGGVSDCFPPCPGMADPRENRPLRPLVRRVQWVYAPEIPPAAGVSGRRTVFYKGCFPCRIIAST